MPLRRRIDRLLGLPSSELGRPEEAAEIEDVVQRGFTAVHSGEMWTTFVSRELESALERGDTERAPALVNELRSSRASLEAVRARVTKLSERAQQVGVGSPRAAARRHR